jgi:hypothetical protein
MNEFRNDGEIPADIAVQLRQKLKSGSKADGDLAVGLHFNNNDLNSNRRGKISERQRKRLAQKGKNLRHNFVNAAIFFSIIFVPLGLIGLLALDNFTNTGVFLLFLLVAFVTSLTPFGIILYMGYSEWKVIKAELKEGRVKAKKGKVILHPVGGGQCPITIGRSRFKLHYQAYLRFRHLDPYIIYYTPKSRIILSAEPMEQ